MAPAPDQDDDEIPADRKPGPGEGGDDVTADEYATIEDDDDIHTELDDDGSMLVTIGEAVEERGDQGEFYANLADDIIPDNILDRIATDLLQKIDQDKEARKPRDEQYSEGIRRTGLGKDAPGGAQFEGASRVVHPMMTEACIDYEARIIKELWPTGGPVKERIIGVPTKEKAERAARKTEFLNYQITTQIEEARAVMETTLTQVPLGGSQFIKVWQDHRLGRPRWQFVPVDKIYLPAIAESFTSATRWTYADILSEVEYRQRVEQGQYRDWDLTAPSQIPDTSKTEKSNQKVEGVDDQSLNVDGAREIYETMTYLDVSSDMAAALGGVEEEDCIYPYLISIDVTSKKVLSLYRNWEEPDRAKKPIEHLFEFPFIPWRGAYSIGLPQIIGGLSGAATGALRGLLDSAHINNSQGGFILKGSGTSGQTRQPQIGEYVEIESGMETQDIRSKVMPFATKEPSQTLFQLLGFLSDAGAAAVRTSLDEGQVGGNTNVPVGTQLSRVEEGLVVFSAIHGRIHVAFNRLLMGMHRLNAMYLPETLRVDDNGKEILVRRKDFEGPIDIQPVSDPTIYSDQQRFWQISAIQARQVQVPGLYKPHEVERRFLDILKVPDPDSLLVEPPQPKELNAVNENVAMSMGQPVVVFPDQDHLAHLQTHLDFMGSPILGKNPLIAPKFLSGALQHCAEHMLYFYASQNNDLITQAAGRRASELMTGDTHVKEAFDQLLALASSKVVPELVPMFQGAMPVLMAGMQLLQSMKPPPPMDPTAAAIEAAKMETGRKTAADQAKAALDQAELERQTKKDQIDGVAKAAQMLATKDIAHNRDSTAISTTEMDNQTALEIADMRVSHGEAPGISDGAGIGG